MNLRPLEPMLRPFGLAILLVTAFVTWVPDPEARRPIPPPPCEVLAAEFAFRFHPLADGRLPRMEERVLDLIVPEACRVAWSYDPPRAWDLARLDQRPRPKQFFHRPGWAPDPVPDLIPGRYLAPNPLI